VLLPSFGASFLPKDRTIEWYASIPRASQVGRTPCDRQVLLFLQQAILPTEQDADGPNAAIALYRALLSKCRSAPPCLDKSALKAVVKNSFIKNRHVTSKYVLQDAFAGGYEVYQHPYQV